MPLGNFFFPFQLTSVALALKTREVKATTGRSKSAKTVLNSDKYDANIGYKLSENNIGVAGKMITLPYYMAMFLA